MILKVFGERSHRKMNSTKHSPSSPRKLIVTDAQYQELWGAFGVTNFVKPIPRVGDNSKSEPMTEPNVLLPSIEAMHYDFEYGNRV